LNILLAPNALKGSLSASSAAEAMALGIRRRLPDADIRTIPVADGGDGMIEAIAGHLSAEPVECTVTGPLGQPVRTAFLYAADRQLAIIEMARASGLALLPPHELDALNATSTGTGELIKAALNQGCRHIVLGIGGSATTDAATGLATALGVRFLDEHQKPVSGNGGCLQTIRTIDTSNLDPRLCNVTLEVACDVDNPLIGPEGAAAVYGPQKGATQDDVWLLERGLSHFGSLLEAHAGRELESLAGAGAAGGAGAGLVGLLNATLKPGARLVLDLLKVEAAVAQADLVFTCEGHLDSQTCHGKAPAAVAGLAKKHRVPCVGIAGAIDDHTGQLHEAGFDALFSLCPGPVSLDQALAHAADYLANTAEQVMRCRQTAIPRLQAVDS